MYRFSCENEGFGRKARWFFIGKYILDYVDDDGAERYLIEEIHTGVPCHVYASTIKAVT